MTSEKEEYKFSIRAISAGLAYIGYIRLPDSEQYLVYDGEKWVAGTPEVEANEFGSPAEVVECAIQELNKWVEKDRWRFEREKQEKLRKQARRKMEAVLSEEEIEALGL